jgi:tRNA(Phe) wybutosine-synthesizing methylase Tyw3
LKITETERVLILAKNKDACVQKTIFIFPFFIEKQKNHLTQSCASGRTQQLEKVEPASIKAFGQLLARRMERIAAMVEILQGFSQEWVFLVSGNCLFMEAKDIETTKALEELSRRGFGPGDFSWKVEYSRSWGFM